MNKKILFVTLIIAMLIVSMVPASFAFDRNVLRSKAVQKYDASVKQYKVAKQNYVQAKQDWVSAREQWKSASAQWKNSKNGGAGGAIDQSKIIEKAKSFLVAAVDRVVKHMETLKNRINSMDEIQDKESITKEIDAKISYLNDDIKPRIEAAETREELNAVAKEVKAEWKKTKPLIKKVVGEVLSSRIDKALVKLDEVSQKASDKIKELEAQGYDVSQLKEKQPEIQKKIDAAKVKLKEARAKFSSISSSSDVDATFKEGRDLLKEASQLLREAFKEVKELVKSIRETVKEGVPQ